MPSCGRAPRVAVLAGPRRYEMSSQAMGPLQPGEARVEIEGCGVCGSNAPVWEGRPWFDYPLAPGAPGHEAWGRVSAVGEGVTGDDCRPGDRVALLFDRSFSDAVDLPASSVVVLPEALGDQPFPGEAIGSAVNVARRSGFRRSETVAVIGIGFLGALVVALAAEAGSYVVAISRRAFSLEVARAMGAATVIRLGDPAGVVDEVTELTGGALCDVVVEAVGAQGPLDLAGRLTKVRGRLVIAGFHQDGARTADIQLWNWRGIDVVNAHERDDEARLSGIRQGADLVARGRLDPSLLYTHSYPLELVGAAMDVMLERPDGFLKALVRP